MFMNCLPLHLQYWYMEEVSVSNALSLIPHSTARTVCTWVREQWCMVSAGSKPSWTAKLANNQELLCSKIREEAGELCETLEKDEGQERAASEMADLLYHSMVLLHVQVCFFQCTVVTCCPYIWRV